MVTNLCVRAAASTHLLSRPLLSLSHFSAALSLPRRHFKPYSSSAPSFSPIKMSAQIIEHIVLFRVKPETDPSKIDSMMTGLNGLTSLNQVLYLTAGLVLRNQSSAFAFTHMLHSRYKTKEDLAAYSDHPDHLGVVRQRVLPICEDIMAVDWVASGLDGPVVPPSGLAMRVTFLKLKEGSGDNEKNEVLAAIAGIKETFPAIEQMSFGENFSPARAKGFSIASIAILPGASELEALKSSSELINLQKDKVREFLESVIVLDYAIPQHQQSASL